jgi:hypothetical protein
MPSPWHVAGVQHGPQESVPPQPSSIVPHCVPHVAGTQAWHWLPLHVSEPMHWPHEIQLPHPSMMAPHVAPSAAHVVGVHGAHVKALVQP